MAIAASGLVCLIACRGSAAQETYRLLTERLSGHFPAATDRSAVYLKVGLTTDSATGQSRLADVSRYASESVNRTDQTFQVQRRHLVIQLKPDASAERIHQFLRKWDLKVVGGDLNIGMLIVNVGDTTGAAAGFVARGGATPENDAANWLRLLAAKMREETDVVRAAAANIPQGTTDLPPRTDCSGPDEYGQSFSVSWTVEPHDHDGNWGQKKARFPAAWNFNRVIEKARPGVKIKVAVLDIGFAAHEDLEFTDLSPEARRARYPHGNHVAGIIGANWNKVGINGCTKFADLHVHRVDLTGQKLENKAEMPTVISEVFDKTSWLLLSAPNLKDLKVINISLGTNWAGNYKINPNLDAKAKRDIEALAPVARQIAEDAAKHDVIIVVSAGNDSRGQATVDAQWSCPFNWIAANPLEGKAPMWNVLVVEALGRDGNLTPYSNIKGRLSAYGDEVLSTIDRDKFDRPRRNAYGVMSGTSMAGPQVSALIANMYAYNPKLTPQEVVAALVRSSVLKREKRRDRLPDGAPTIDAFAAMLECYGGDQPLSDLADLNDSGRVDMDDFKMFQDALHQVEGPATEKGADDLNGDGVSGTNEEENVWPRADLNGSGRLSRDEKDRRRVKGRDCTDLEVMMRVWKDPTVKAAELPNLLDAPNRGGGGK
jgi:hypothetical protein